MPAVSGDFSYLNPVSAGHTGDRDRSEDRLADAKAEAAERFQKQKGTPPLWALASNQTLREEGSLHAAMVYSALSKLDPYQGVSYRGEAVTQQTFEQRAKVGRKFSFPNITSTSKYAAIAKNFGEAKGAKDVSVYWIFKDAGKDVEPFSMLTGEGEVLVEPAEEFVVERIVDLDAVKTAPSEGKQLYDMLLKGKATSKARKTYIVHVSAPKTPADLPLLPLPPAPRPPLPMLPLPQEPGPAKRQGGRSGRRNRQERRPAS